MPILPTPFEINHAHKIFCIGSCFAEHMFHKFQKSQFQVTSSPFGIVFNSLSIARQLTAILDQELILEEDLVYFDHLYHSMLHHSTSSNHDPKIMLHELNKHLVQSNAALIESDFVLITLGTSFYYRLKDSGKIVSNCHRLPQELFTKEQASTDEMVDGFYQLITRLLELDNNKKIILTVSPVRYLRDGFIQNARSKAALLLCCEALEKRLDNVFYFPSYELLMDDLRDYRFTQEDMVHPTSQTIDYIWNYFEQMFFNDRTRLINLKIERLNKKLYHRPLFSEHPSHTSLKEIARDELAQLKQDYPEVNFKFNNLEL
ncbi:MAG TPA: GSCFA domain-containing protein [Saprospiraceae bacterium]|nr:GSCFA domain-containing protein [Saprospiraceae bacterium]